MMQTQRNLQRRIWRAGLWQTAPRTLPEEVPVALSYNGSTQAVMMATPADLEDFARGFTLTEGIATLDEIEDITIAETPGGHDAQIWLAANAESRLAARRRHMMGPTGCGLCGIDSIEAALRSPRNVETWLRLAPASICNAMTDLPRAQRLHDATRAAHAAAFLDPDKGIGPLREDVGRHNALDKLAGALAAGGLDAATGAVVLTSRLSIDLIQKAAAIGSQILIGVSAPTAHAVHMADKAGITLIGLARPDGFEVFTHPHRIVAEDRSHVA